MKKRLFTLLLLFVLFALSCTKVESDVKIDASLLPFFEVFREEGAKRGVLVDFQAAGVEGVVSDISQNDVVGQCSHSEEIPNKVTIDPVFWRLSSNSRKEFVIFHELGHCYLQRSHLDATDEQGNCLSIMQSSADVCKSNYENQRDKYLDELFSL